MRKWLFCILSTISLVSCAKGTPETQRCTEQIGMLSYSYDAASICINARDIAISRYGEEHPETLINELVLVGIYINLGEYSKAEPLLEHISLSMKKQNQYSRETSMVLLQFQLDIYEGQDLYEKAEPLYFELLKIIKDGESKQDVIDELYTLDDLSNNYRLQKKLDSALLYLNKAEAKLALLNEADLGNGVLSTHYLVKAKYLITIGELDSAEQLLQKAQALDIESFGSDSLAMSYVNKIWARLYAARNDLKQAQNYKEKAFNICVKQLFKTHPDCQEILNDF